jgi:hypothetical protein
LASRERRHYYCLCAFVVQHLFRVAAGLDSMLMERQKFLLPEAFSSPHRAAKL